MSGVNFSFSYFEGCCASRNPDGRVYKVYSSMLFVYPTPFFSSLSILYTYREISTSVFINSINIFLFRSKNKVNSKKKFYRFRYDIRLKFRFMTVQRNCRCIYWMSTRLLTCNSTSVIPLLVLSLLLKKDESS